MTKSPPNRVRYGEAEDEEIGLLRSRLVDDRGADVACLEEDGLQSEAESLRRGLGDVEDALGLLGQLRRRSRRVGSVQSISTTWSATSAAFWASPAPRRTRRRTGRRGTVEGRYDGRERGSGSSRGGGSSGTSGWDVVVRVDVRVTIPPAVPAVRPRIRRARPAGRRASKLGVSACTGPASSTVFGPADERALAAGSSTGCRGSAPTSAAATYSGMTTKVSGASLSGGHAWSRTSR